MIALIAITSIAAIVLAGTLYVAVRAIASACRFQDEELE